MNAKPTVAIFLLTGILTLTGCGVDSSQYCEKAERSFSDWNQAGANSESFDESALLADERLQVEFADVMASIPRGVSRSAFTNVAIQIAKVSQARETHDLTQAELDVLDSAFRTVVDECNP